jgi:hypothetical protein
LTQEERERILNMASDIGLSCMYDASRDSYTNWCNKVLAFAAQLKKEQDERTIRSDTDD